MAGKVPLHSQLANLLRSQISSGVFAPGDRLPTEKELMDRYGVSSSTVRGAVLALVREGLLYRKAGKGTFLTPPKIERDLLTFSGFSEEALAKGFRPGSRLVGARWSPPPPSVAAALNVQADDRVFEVERVRTVDDAVVALETVYFPRPIGDHLALLDFAGTPLTTLLEEHLGLPLERAYQVIRAVGATAPVAAALEVKPGAPLLLIDRTALLRDDRVCYFSSSYYRADRYDYCGWIERPRRPSGVGVDLVSSTPLAVGREG